MMTLTRHIQVMKIAFRRYTGLYVSRRRKGTIEQLNETFMTQGIEIDTFEHNRKLTINIEFLCG